MDIYNNLAHNKVREKKVRATLAAFESLVTRTDGNLIRERDAAALNKVRRFTRDEY